MDLTEKYLEGYENYFDKFKELFELYNDWNSKINVSSIRDEEWIYLKHFLDSLLWNEVFNFEWKKVLDVWSWWGFPLFPLWITNPSADFTALDSVWKKIKVISEISKWLGLKNISTLNWRAEDLWQKKKYREKFDVVVTRAFAPWTIMLELTVPFLKVWWTLIAYQTPSIFEDIKKNEMVLDELWVMISDTAEFELANNSWERLIVLIEKTEKTDRKFPRGVWIPKMEPLD